MAFVIKAPSLFRSIKPRLDRNGDALLHGMRCAETAVAWADVDSLYAGQKKVPLKFTLPLPVVDRIAAVASSTGLSRAAVMIAAMHFAATDPYSPLAPVGRAHNDGQPPGKGPDKRDLQLNQTLVRAPSRPFPEQARIKSNSAD